VIAMRRDVTLVAFVVKQGETEQSKEIQKQQVLALIVQKQITCCPDVKNAPISIYDKLL